MAEQIKFGIFRWDYNGTGITALNKFNCIEKYLSQNGALVSNCNHTQVAVYKDLREVYHYRNSTVRIDIGIDNWFTGNKPDKDSYGKTTLRVISSDVDNAKSNLEEILRKTKARN